MPAAPYFHGDEEIFEQDGVLLARRVGPGAHTRMLEIVKVLTLDRRYALAYWMSDGHGQWGTVWRTSRGDAYPGASLEDIIARTRYVFEGNPRYRLGAVA